MGPLALRGQGDVRREDHEPREQGEESVQGSGLGLAEFFLG